MTNPSSNPPKALPQGVAQDELYDGPRPNGAGQPKPNQRPNLPDPEAILTPIPQKQQRQPAPQVSEAAVLSAALDVLSARLMGLIAVLAACGMWGWAVYEPEQLRTIAASLFSITVLMPLVYLYAKQG